MSSLVIDEEPGEIVSSDDEDEYSTVNSNRHVSSEVVRADQNVGSKYEKFKHWRNDPDFKEFLKEFVDERISDNGQSQRLKESKGRSSDGTETIPCTPKNKKGEVNQGRAQVQMFKSPFDTTIYSPGLRRASNEDVSLIEKISNFVESIRLDSRRETSQNQQSDRSRSRSRS